jgi:hypothetical protein
MVGISVTTVADEHRFLHSSKKYERLMTVLLKGENHDIWSGRWSWFHEN